MGKPRGWKYLLQKGKSESLLLGTAGIYFKARKLKKSCQSAGMQRKSKWCLEIPLKDTQSWRNLTFPHLDRCDSFFNSADTFAEKYESWLRCDIPLWFGWIVTEAEHLAWGIKCLTWERISIFKSLFPSPALTDTSFRTYNSCGYHLVSFQRQLEQNMSHER